MKGDFTRLTFKPENHYHSVLKQQGRVDLDADWNEQDAITGHRVETETIDVVGQSGAPAGNAGFVLTPIGGGANLNISAGRAYVDGILCENEKAVPITQQPDLPGFKLPAAAGNYIAYLEVWLRPITALDDASIREVALGGPDTCTRSKTVWQVGLLPVKQTGIDCSTATPEWTSLIAASTGTLAARAQPDGTKADPCLIPVKAGYRRLENQLYRVEVHDATAGKATFKWSRDNGSMAANWLAPQSGQPANTLRVSTTGPDSVLGFAAGQWVELTDDVRELNFQPGTLVQLTGVSGSLLTYDSDPSHAIPPGPIAFPTSPDPATYPEIHSRIRRWDSIAALPVASGTWTDLEDGVQVNFSGGTFAQGDYWLIPARTLTADVEWPEDASGNPVPQSPKGIRRHFCKVAVVQLTGTSWSVVAPCLPTFPPLTGITAGADEGFHVQDVRTAIPDASLANDSVLAYNLAQIREEFTIRVICDAVVDPVSAKPTTCFMALEIPYPFSVGNPTPGVIWGYQPLVLPATVRVAANSRGGSEILLIVTGAPLGYLQGLLTVMAELNLGRQVLVRLTLKGDCIWSREDPTMFLDGDAFGITRTDTDGSTHIGLRLPRSGDGKRGGDFQMWFYLTLPVGISSLAFNPNAINSGQATTLTVTLTGPAPANAVVTLTDNSQTVLNLPPTVTVAQGQTSVDVSVTQTQLPPGVGAVTVQATGTYQNTSASGSLTISPVLTIVKLGLSATQILGPAPVTATVTISAPAGSNGATVAVSSNNVNAKTPASVLVPPGQTTATFLIGTVLLPTNSGGVTATISATLGNTVTTQLLVLAPRLT